MGVTGAVCFVLALAVLPWFAVGGQDVTLSDMRTAFAVPETPPADEPAGAEGDSSSRPEAVGQQARETVGDAAGTAIDTGKARYLEFYTETLWVVAAGAVGVAAVVSTVLAPRSGALALLLGFRRLAGFVTVLVGAAHGAALWVVFGSEGAPDPAFGVWLGVGGLVAVLVGCILGPKR